MNKIFFSLSISAIFGGICYLILPVELKAIAEYAEIAFLLNLSYVCGRYSVFLDMFAELDNRYGDAWDVRKQGDVK